MVVAFSDKCFLCTSTRLVSLSTLPTEVLKLVVQNGIVNEGHFQRLAHYARCDEEDTLIVEDYSNLNRQSYGALELVYLSAFRVLPQKPLLHFALPCLDIYNVQLHKNSVDTYFALPYGVSCKVCVNDCGALLPHPCRTLFMTISGPRLG